MVTNVQVIDDFMEEEQFKKLQNILVGHSFPWFYTEYVSLAPTEGQKIKDPLAMETPGYSHIFYDGETDRSSLTIDLLEDFFKTLTRRLGYTGKHLIRARASIKNPKPGFTEENYNLPHVDYYFPHDTIVFYINDCDGDTRMFNEFFTPVPGTMGIGSETFTTQQRIPPKANRLLLFDGLQYHTASNPINSNHRIIININLDKI